MKTIVKVSIALFLLQSFSACNPAVSVKTEVKSDLDSLVHRYFETFNRHDAKTLGLFYADSADMKDPSIGKSLQRMARTDIEKKYAEMFGYFKTLKDSVIATYPSGNCITVEFISVGTLPDSSKLYLPICTIFEFKNQKIIKDFTYYNNANE